MGHDGKLFEALIYNKYMSESKYIDDELGMVNRYIVKKLNSLVMYNNFDNVLTIKEKFLKIYNGSCDNCFAINFLNEKCGTVTPLLYLDNKFNYYCKQSTVSCRDNCGLVYIIDDCGNISYVYEGESCDILTSGHVNF